VPEGRPMSTWRFTIELEIDDELLAEHDGKEKPPPNDPADWYGGDLYTALTDGFAEVVHDELDGQKVS
jgi:hypothetical protein